MAIIYTYPTKSNPVSGDLLLMSDSADNNTTKQATISSIKDTIDVVDSLTATLPIQVSGSTGTITISSRAYGGSGTTGYVPAGGTSTTFLKGNGSFSNINLSTDATGTLIVENGGTGFTGFASVGMLMYSDSTSTMAKLAIGDPGLVLKVNSAGSAPEWTADTDTTYTAGNGIDINTATNPDTINAGLLANGGLVFNASKMQVDLGASSIGGTLAISNGGTGATSLPSTITNSTVNYSSDGTGTLPVAKGGTGSALTTFCNLTSNVTGILPVANGGTGLSTVSVGLIPRGNATGAFVADSYLQYEGTSKSLKVRGTGNTSPTLACTLGIDDAQGPSGKDACIGLTPTGAQGAKGLHIDLGAYNAGMQISRNSQQTGVAIQFQQTVSGTTGIGSISMTNSTVTYGSASDYRLKENVVDMTGSVDRVKQLKPKRFNFTVDPGITVDGFLAHEAQSIVPESVTGSKDEVDKNGKEVYQGIDQAKLVPLLVGAIKELTARIEALES